MYVCSCVVRFYTAEIAIALLFLHSRGVAYRLHIYARSHIRYAIYNMQLV